MLNDEAEMPSSGGSAIGKRKMIDRRNKQLAYRRTHVELKLEYFVIYWPCNGIIILDRILCSFFISSGGFIMVRTST